MQNEKASSSHRSSIPGMAGLHASQESSTRTAAVSDIEEALAKTLFLQGLFG